MPQAGPAPAQKLVTELKVSGHLMTLEKGLFCVFHAPGSTPADPQTGLPGVRITHPPLQEKQRITISSFNDDGWIGAEASAALVRVNEGPSQLLVTIYQNGAGQHEAPKLQVMRLGDVPERAPEQVPERVASQQTTATAVVDPEPPAPAPVAPPVDGAEVAAHVQRRGDRLGKLGDWMGEPGSQSWIEGFAIAPNKHIGPADIEYQAVLGKGWLSPWSEGGQYCGSRGMALPILGLRVRLKGHAAETHILRVSATFTDGSKVGPVADTETAEAESLAPLEAFRIEIMPVAGAASDEPDDHAATSDAAPGAVSLPASVTPLAARPALPAEAAAPAKSASKLRPPGKSATVTQAAAKPGRPARR